MSDRSPNQAGLDLLKAALRNLALREPKLLIGFNNQVIDELNTLRAEHKFGPITDSTLRLTYLPQLGAEFGKAGDHGPLYLELTDDVLDELVARRIQEQEERIRASQA